MGQGGGGQISEFQNLMKLNVDIKDKSSDLEKIKHDKVWQCSENLTSFIYLFFKKGFNLN